MFNFFKKEKIVDTFVKYSKETARVNPDMILREYNRMIIIEESKLIWKFPEECYLSFEIERDYIGDIKDNEKFYLLERTYIEETGYKKTLYCYK